MKKILFLTPHRLDRSPSQRYRFEQYLPFIKQNFSVTISNLLNERDDKIFYGKGGILLKVWIVFKSLLTRISDFLRIQKYDIVYIHKSAFFIGTIVESLILSRARYVVMDFDDAIWVMHKNQNQGLLNRLKNPNKTAKVLQMVDKVVTGNEYLAEYAAKFNSNVNIIPSTIDFNKYRSERDVSKKVCIGWTGSLTTLRYFEPIIPVLEQLKKNYGESIYFKVIGIPEYSFETIGAISVPWNSATEATDLAELDIGLMPLPDNEWTRGKCSMKAIQYMALGIPAVVSPVGMNKEVIHDGVNGFLADEEDEWVQKLSLLIEGKALRKRLGEAGKKTVVEKYSVEANKEKWLKVFQT